MSSDNSQEIKGSEDTISSEALDAGSSGADAATPDELTTPSEPPATAQAEAVIEEADQKTEIPSAPEPQAPTLDEAAPAPKATAPAAQPSPPTPSIAERVSVPAQSPTDVSDESGGEWEMLSGRIKEFWESNNLVEWWKSLRQPVVVLGALIAAILALRIYGGILDAIATVPLAPRLLQLVGTIYAGWYAATRLVKSEERKKASSNLKDLWTTIRGGGKG